MKIIIKVTAFLLLSVPWSAQASGSRYSLDCDQATTNIENKICENRDLWQLDSLLNRHYHAALARGREQALRQDQRQWLLSARDQCGSTECLFDAYATRIEFLKRWEFSDPYCGNHSYPPFPDTWGYEFNDKGVRAVFLSGLPSGEVWLRVPYNADGETEEFIQCFFSGNRKRAIDEDGQYFAFEYGDSIGYGKEGVRLRGGSAVVSGRHQSGGGRCVSPFRQYLQIKGPDGRVQKRIAVLILFKEPQEEPYSSDCEGSAPGNKNYYTTYVKSASLTEAVTLMDGTVIVNGGDYDFPFAIRFRDDLTTEYRSSRIVVVPYSKVRSIYRSANNVQKRADLVRKFVIEKIQEEN